MINIDIDLQYQIFYKLPINIFSPMTCLLLYRRISHVCLKNMRDKCH